MFSFCIWLRGNCIKTYFGFIQLGHIWIFLLHIFDLYVSGFWQKHVKQLVGYYLLNVNGCSTLRDGRVQPHSHVMVQPVQIAR